MSMARLFLPPALVKVLPRPVHQHRHLRRFGRDRQRARLDARHVQQVGNQVVHVVGLLVDDPEKLTDHGRVQVGG